MGNAIEIPILQRINSQPADLQDVNFWQNHIGDTAKINQHYFEIVSTSKEGVVSLIDSNQNEKYLSAQEINPKATALYKTEWIEGNTLHINFNGTVIFQLLKEQPDRHIDYAYAITSYASQGASIQYVIVYASNNTGLTSMDNTYVELSSVKKHV
ncbi:MAG TPA: hypothetical protein ACHBX0_09825 [Arsenophonus sp.]